MGCLQTNSYSELPETRAILPVDPQNCSPSSFSEANPGSLKNHSFSLSGLRQIHVEPTVGLCRKSAVYGLNGHRSNFVKALSLGAYEHAIWKSRSFTALFSWTLALRFIKPGLKSTQKSPLTLPSISGFRTNCDKFGSAHSSLQVTVVVALSEIQVPYSIE